MLLSRTFITPSLSLDRVVSCEHATARLAELTGINKFPGSNPCSIERASLPLLKNAYFVAEKTNGVRFLLMCTVLEARNTCVLVNRALHVFILPLRHVPTALFQGTVLDCELAWDMTCGRWTLMVFDALVVSSINVSKKPFSVRMAAARRGLRDYVRDPGDPVDVELKHFIPVSMLEVFEAHLASMRCRFDADGVIFVPEDSPVVVGRHLKLFKLKTVHTVDFLVGEDGLSLSVFDSSSGRHVRVGRLLTHVDPKSIAECTHVREDVWMLTCVRTDKQTANDMLTYQKTMLNAREALTLQDIRAALQ